MNSIWLVPALVCYALSAAGFAMERAAVNGRLARTASLLLGAGAALQTGDLLLRGIQAGNIPVTNFPQSLIFLAWLTALAGLVVIVRLRMPVIGVFVAPLVFVLLALNATTMRQAHLTVPQTLRSAWLPIHVTLALLGYALFVLAAGVSLVYLVYEKRLKTKRPLLPSDERTPSLEKLDRINYRLLGWGFLMLSLAIITGAIWADATWGHFWSWEPAESWTLVIWFLYAGLLESRLTVGWRGRRAAALTIAVFTILVGSFVGVSLMAPGKHGGNFG
ncbi:MAG TPA: c-type cytochrome biogenesis protein CcsB [Candidatus Binataceae bacterium]|jgi:cytochrome c-type biogenesis protein CcsB|nr:c-type cytochrome biogenesis protein CcsB [Candidatus Binataceae bacterium]